MTIEQNPPQGPQPPMGPAPQGQQAHRRRRRRRKGKNNGQPNAQATGQPPIQQKQSNRPKKSPKFFPKNNNGSQQAGNGQGNRRKNKQRKPQVFVGPMDHSYRVANGNIADGPPSTIPIHGSNGNGNHGTYYAQPLPVQPITVREDAPTRIFCFIEDLFFLAKTQEVARKLGVKVGFVKNDKESLAKLTAASEEKRPALIVFDLNNANAKPLTLIPKIKAKLKRGTSVIGFLSHLQGDLKMKAIEAGCDTVMPRSAFSQNLPNLLRRYGLEEEEELDYQPISG
jgi:CheY-like chemotaxis protein